MTQELADKFAAEWIAAWNAHDLEQIVRHYTDDVEFISPFAIKLLNNPAGTVNGKAALRKYFSAGLAKYPNLNFQLLHVYCGVRSVTLGYRSVNNLIAAEVMELNTQGRVTRVLAHYTSADERG